MSLVPNRAWQRHRSVHYAGAFRWYDKYSGIYFRNCHPCTPLHKRHNLVQNAVNSEEMTNSQISNDFKGKT